MDAKLELKCLKRYLKNKGVFAAFKRNVNNKRIRNITKPGNPSYEGLNTIGVLSKAIKREDMLYIRNIISAMFVWDKTKEGYEFWSPINKEYSKFRTEYLERTENGK